MRKLNSLAAVEMVWNLVELSPGVVFPRMIHRESKKKNLTIKNTFSPLAPNRRMLNSNPVYI